VFDSRTVTSELLHPPWLPVIWAQHGRRWILYGTCGGFRGTAVSRGLGYYRAGRDIVGRPLSAVPDSLDLRERQVDRRRQTSFGRGHIAFRLRFLFLKASRGRVRGMFAGWKRRKIGAWPAIQAETWSKRLLAVECRPAPPKRDRWLPAGLTLANAFRLAATFGKKRAADRSGPTAEARRPTTADG